jgi:hypothetical protein
MKKLVAMLPANSLFCLQVLLNLQDFATLPNLRLNSLLQTVRYASKVLNKKRMHNSNRILA